MFSKDKFRLDVIGHWLGGHEPGNIHLFRIAKERGLTDTFNPWEIPVYEWVNGRAVERKLTDFERTPLPSGYLPLPGEPEFHLCNEPFDYPQEPVSACLSGQAKPELRVLGRHHRGRQGPQALIEYSLPHDGNACVEVYDAFGERVGVLARGQHSRGIHMAAWEASGVSPGVYFSRLRTQGYDHVQRLAVLG